MVFVLSGISLIFAIPREGLRDIFGVKVLLHAAGAFILISSVTLAVLVLRGSSLWSIFDTLLLTPRTFIVYQVVPLNWPAQELAIAISSLTAFLLAYYLRKIGQLSMANTLVVFVRILSVVGILVIFVITPNVGIQRAIVPYIVIPLWSFLWPLEGKRNVLPMAWLCWFSLGQWMQAYPAAGDEHFQLGSMTALMAMFIGISEALCWIREKLGDQLAWGRAKSMIIYALIIGAMCITTVRATKQGARAYLEDRQYFRMKSAETIRLSDSETILYRSLSLNAAYYADYLYTFPHRMGYREWAGLPIDPPSILWMYAGDVYEKQKRHIVEQLKSHPRSMVIIQDSSMPHFHLDRGLRYDDILFKYVKENYHQAYSLFGYSFHVKNGRPNPIPLFVGNLKEDAQSKTMRLVLTYTAEADRPIGSVEISEMGRSRHPLQILDSKNASYAAIAISRDGERTGNPVTGTLPIRWDGALMMEFSFAGSMANYKGRPLMALLRDPEGREIGMIFVTN